MTLDISTAELARCFTNGESLDSLARRFGCHRGTVWYRLTKAGVRRAKPNSRVMLKSHRETLLELLAQLKSALDTVKIEFAKNASVREKREGYLRRIERLTTQIAALQDLTR